MGSGDGQKNVNTGSSTLSGIAAGASVGGPWGAAVGGLMGLAGGIMGGKKESAYEEQQKAALAADQAKRDQFAAQQAAVYGPIQKQLGEEAANPTPMNYGANLGAINTQAQQAQQRLGGQMAKEGMIGSGAQAAGQQGIEMGRVGELSQAFNTGLQARNKLGMDLLQHYNPLGNTQLQTGALPSAMKFGAGEQASATAGMQQGFGAFGTGLAGVINGLNKPGGNPGGQQPLSANAYGDWDLANSGGGASPAGLGFGGNPGMGSTSAQSGGSEFPAGWDMFQTGGTAAVPAESGGTPTDAGGGLNLWNPFAMAEGE